MALPPMPVPREYARARAALNATPKARPGRPRGRPRLPRGGLDRIYHEHCWILDVRAVVKAGYLGRPGVRTGSIELGNWLGACPEPPLLEVVVSVRSDGCDLIPAGVESEPIALVRVAEGENQTHWRFRCGGERGGAVRRLYQPRVSFELMRQMGVLEAPAWRCRRCWGVRYGRGAEQDSLSDAVRNLAELERLERDIRRSRAIQAQTIAQLRSLRASPDGPVS